jgi:hypothetical protein
MRKDATSELLRLEVRRLLDAAEATTDHETRGRLLTEAFSLAQLAAVKEHERAGGSEGFAGTGTQKSSSTPVRGTAISVSELQAPAPQQRGTPRYDRRAKRP